MKVILKREDAKSMSLELCVFAFEDKCLCPILLLSDKKNEITPYLTQKY